MPGRMTVRQRCDGGEVEEGGDLLEVVGNGHGAGDDVEEDVPLGAEEHKGDGSDAHAAAGLDEGEQKDGKEGGGGDGGGDLREGLGDAGEAGVEADGDAGGDGPEGGENKRKVDAGEGGQGADEDLSELVEAYFAKERHGVERSVEDGGGEERNEEDAEPERHGVGGGRVRPGFDAPCGAHAAVGDARVEALNEAGGGVAVEELDGGGLLEQMQQRGADAGFGFDLLELEAVAPRNDGSPDELIGGDDDEHHGGKSPGHGGSVVRRGGRLEVGAKAGQAEVAGAEDEHLAGHEEEPAAGDRDHRVPDEADGGERELELDEALEGRELVDTGGFGEFLWDAFDGGVEGEGHVPDLAGEDQQDGAHFDADLARGKEGDHGEHDAGKEGKHGDGLEDIEGGKHEGLDARVVGGDVAVSYGEDER